MLNKGDIMKHKIIGYVTTTEKAIIQKRAKMLGMSIGAYFFELSMWDNRDDLLPKLRQGDSIISNRKPIE